MVGQLELVFAQHVDHLSLAVDQEEALVVGEQGGTFLVAAHYV